MSIILPTFSQNKNCHIIVESPWIAIFWVISKYILTFIGEGFRFVDYPSYNRISIVVKTIIHPLCSLDCQR